jgi:hypothetical protein
MRIVQKASISIAIFKLRCISHRHTILSPYIPEIKNVSNALWRVCHEGVSCVLKYYVLLILYHKIRVAKIDGVLVDWHVFLSVITPSISLREAHCKSVSRGHLI